MMTNAFPILKRLAAFAGAVLLLAGCEAGVPTSPSSIPLAHQSVEGSASTGSSVTASSVNGLSAIILSATGYTVSGMHRIRLDWFGSSATTMQIYLNGNLHAQVTNTGTWTHSPFNRRGRATYHYFVCETATSICSNSVTVEFYARP